MQFSPIMYRTAGNFQIVEYTPSGYNDTAIAPYTYVGSQVQFQKVVKTDGTITYKPKWVVSGSRSASDVQKKRNTLIISFLPAMDLDTTGKLECTNPSDITNSVTFCSNIFGGSGGAVPAARFIKKKYTATPKSADASNFYSYEAYLYASCQDVSGGSCFDGTFKPDDGGTVGGYDLDSIANNIWKELWFTDDSTAGTDNQKAARAKKFEVVIEFLDQNGNLFTSKFPYNGNLDNLGNHTPVHMYVRNFPDPYADTSGYTAGVAFGTATHDNQYIFTDNMQPTYDSNTTDNCIGLQQGLTCNQVVAATAATIGSSSQKDDDITHKLQLAGKEFRAKGTDIDPRFEMILRGIQFDVQRGVHRFLD